MGIIHKPFPTVCTTQFFSEAMPRNRFCLILKFLHSNDNEDPLYNKNDEDRDKLHKLCPIIDHFCDHAKSVYNPGQQLSND